MKEKLMQIKSNQYTGDSLIIFVKNGNIYFDMLVDHTGTRIEIKDNETKGELLKLLMQLQFKKKKQKV